MSGKQNLELKKTLTPFNLWVIGVGIVISGNYFGWNFGLSTSGYVGMLIAVGVMAVMYTFMAFGISELSTALPFAGGPYSFARRAMGPFVGFITGVGVVLQYVIAAPVVAIGIGAYINFLFPTVNPIVSAAVMYVFFMVIHIIGVKEYARLEAILVFIALALLVLMYFVGLPQIRVENLFGGEGEAMIPGASKGFGRRCRLRCGSSSRLRCCRCFRKKPAMRKRHAERDFIRDVHARHFVCLDDDSGDRP